MDDNFIGDLILILFFSVTWQSFLVRPISEKLSLKLEHRFYQKRVQREYRFWLTLHFLRETMLFPSACQFYELFQIFPSGGLGWRLCYYTITNWIRIFWYLSKSVQKLPGIASRRLITGKGEFRLAEQFVS